MIDFSLSNDLDGIASKLRYGDSGGSGVTSILGRGKNFDDASRLGRIPWNLAGN